MSVSGFFSMHLLGVALPMTAGFLLYGWRAVIVVGTVVFSAMLGVALWKPIGTRGQQLSYAHTAWLAAVLALMLPASLATALPDAVGETTWLALPAAGLTLVILLWLTGGLGGGRIHPAVAAYLIMAALFGDMLSPSSVLKRDHLFVGDVLKDAPVDLRTGRKDSWLTRPVGGEHDAERSEPASEALTLYTSGRERPARGWLPIQGLLRDAMPPLEDLIIGGAPAAIGIGSRISVIVGGLFLLYRGLIDFRIPLLIYLFEFAALLILPVPSVITDHPQWRWFAFHDQEVGVATAITFANYEIMASPALFMAFFLATSPSLRPMARRGRVIYAALTGILCAAAQLYLSVAYGPYVALLLASLFTPLLDRVLRPRPLF